MNFLIALFAALVLVVLHDIFWNKKHTITRNFPLIGHIRFMMEKIRPELRQYFVEDDRNGQPFNRRDRDYIYASAKGQNNLSGFGSNADFNAAGNFFIKHSTFPSRSPHTDVVGCHKVIGPNRRKPYQPTSIINISAMSFGALGWKATTANNMAALEAGMYHNTGEGGFSPYHVTADQVVFQIGTGYFGCGVTAEDGRRKFDMPTLLKLVEEQPSIKMIECKLSQSAKASHGGLLPAAKVTAEIAAIRGIEQGKSVHSPAWHDAFSTVDEMIDFIELIAEKTGLPVGIKSAVGKDDFWHELAQKMLQRGEGPNFITVDGSGGTGAAPFAFADHVSLPFEDAFTTVYKVFQKYGLTDKVVFIAAGKLGFPAKTVMAFAMGADLVNIAREIMISAGCIQSLECHRSTCPAGIATHSWWLQRGFDIDDKTDRIARFVKTLRSDIMDITHAAGYEHPSEFMMNDVAMNTGDASMRKSLADLFGYEKTKLEVVKHIDQQVA